MPSSSFIATAYRNACLAELEAIKPGNVHIFADGHGMEVQHFVTSAEVSAPAISQPEIGLGERIFLAVEATIAQVQCNTNLGIVILCAPIIQAYLNQTTLAQVIANTTVEDADWLYQAIRLAKPAGIGTREKHDVRETPQITLLQAMQEAQNDDMIARQYSLQFANVLTEAMPLYEQLQQRWERPAWALTGVYLYWLSHYLDSHIQRKYGEQTAQQVQDQAQSHYQVFINLENPKTFLPVLMAWDKQLKMQGINPGTSADLAVATVLATYLQNEYPLLFANQGLKSMTNL